MPRNKGWFRLYDRMIDSPQILELNDTEFRLLISLWCLASAENNLGLITHTIQSIRRRVIPDKSIDEIQQMFEHFKELDLLIIKNEKFIIPRWNIHQYGYFSKIPENRTDIKKINGKLTGSEWEINEKVESESDTESDTDKEKEKEIYKEKEKEKAEKKLKHSILDDQCPVGHSLDDQCLSKQKKQKYAEFVSLTNDEYSSLVAKLGTKDKVDQAIEILDNYKGSSGKKYKSDYRAILTWVIKELKTRQGNKSKQEQPDYRTGKETTDKKYKKDLIKKLYVN